MNLPRHDHRPKLIGHSRRVLIREAARKPTVALSELHRVTAKIKNLLTGQLKSPALQIWSDMKECQKRKRMLFKDRQNKS